MNLLMISGDRSLASGKRGAFYATLEELRKHWERIDVLCPHVACRGEKNFSQRDTVFPNVFLHPSPRGLWYQPLWILKKGKGLSQEHHYNVMTVHDYPPFYNGMGAWLLHRAVGIPWVSEIHHIIGYPRAANEQERIGRMLYPWYVKTIGKNAAAFRVVNATVQECLSRWGVLKEKIHIVPSFYLDHELLQSDPSVEKTYDVVFCARLVANKGLEELLKAVECVTLSSSKGDTAVSALIIGDGPLRSKLEAPHPPPDPNGIVRAGNPLPMGEERSAAVTFTGWLSSPQEVYLAMQSAKIFVMCSKSEGGPRTLLEAMALGFPVIATNVGVVPEVIRDGENGLITTGTPEDLAQKIQKLLSDGALRERLGAEARKVLQRFERKKLVREYAEFLQSFPS